MNSGGYVVLTWIPSDDGSITGYLILRRRPAQGEEVLLAYVANTQSTVATFADRDVTWGVQRVYGVQAISAAGRRQRSNYVNMTPQDRGSPPGVRSAPGHSAQDAGLLGSPRLPAKEPATKNLDTFDFLAIPSVNKAEVMQPAWCEYIERRENDIAIGKSGTGKTHISLGLGLAACQRGMSVGFTTEAALVHELMKARDDRRLLNLQR